MKVSKQVAFILIVIVFYSCNSTKRNALTQLDKDFLIIKESQLELVKSYEKCLSSFADESDVADGYKRIYCNISSSHSEQLAKLNLLKTKHLIDKGYDISLDGKNYYRIFYHFETKEYMAGIIKYGLVYSNIINRNDSIYSLNFGKIDTLKTIDIYNTIIAVNEYAE